MPVTLRATKKTNGQVVVINVDTITYAEPNGDGTTTNIYLASRDTLQVNEPLAVIEDRMNPVAGLHVEENQAAARDETAGGRDTGDPQQRETPANRGKGKPQPPETKAEPEAGNS